LFLTIFWQFLRIFRYFAQKADLLRAIFMELLCFPLIFGYFLAIFAYFLSKTR